MFGTPPTFKAEVEKGEELIEVNAKKELEIPIIEENKRRFSLLQGTLFTRGQLPKDVGIIAEKQGAVDILYGKYNTPENLEQITKELIHIMKKANNKWMNLEDKFTIKEHITEWKKKRENRM